MFAMRSDAILCVVVGDDSNLVRRSGGPRVFVAGMLMMASGLLPYMVTGGSRAMRTAIGELVRADPTGLVAVVGGGLLGLLGLCAIVTVPVGAMMIVGAVLMGTRDVLGRFVPRREETERSEREEAAGPYRSRAARAIETPDPLRGSTLRLRAKLVCAGLGCAGGAAMMFARVPRSGLSSHDALAALCGAALVVFAIVLGGSALFVRWV